MLMSILALFIVSGCDKESDTWQNEPEISISGVSSTAGSVTFTITTKYAENAAYLVLPTSEERAGTADILAKGTQVRTDADGTYTADGLKADMEYVIYAVARNGKGSALATATAQTYSATFIGQNALAIYYGNRDTRNKDRYNYYLVISDVGFTPEMYPKPNGKFFFRIDLYYDKAEDPDNASIPEGTYGFDGLHDEPESGLIGNRSGFFQTDDQSFHTEKHDFESAVLTVSNTSGGLEYRFIAVLDNGKKYNLTYNGDIKFDNQSGESKDGQKDQLPPLEEDINTIFTIGEGSIIAQQDELSQVSLAFSDMAIENGQITPPGNLLNINIITVLQDGKIPERTYTLQNGDSDKNFLIPGQEEYEAGTYYPAFSYVQNYVSSNSSTTGYVNGGSVTVKKSGEGYSFSISLTTKDGHMINGSYDGAFPLYGPGNSTLTDDYDITFQTDTKATAVYYGNYYKTGTANWMLALMPESGKGDAFFMECFNQNLDFAKGLSSGAYTPDGTGKDMTFIPGELNDSGQLAYTYYAYVDGNNIYSFAPITGGSVKISRDGENGATVTIEGIDDSGHKVSGTWTGPFILMDNSSGTTQQNRMIPSSGKILKSTYKSNTFYY